MQIFFLGLELTYEIIDRRGLVSVDHFRRIQGQVHVFVKVHFVNAVRRPSFA